MTASQPSLGISPSTSSLGTVWSRTRQTFLETISRSTTPSVSPTSSPRASACRRKNRPNYPKLGGAPSALHDYGEQLEQKLSHAQISGRYHRAPRTVDHDYNITETPLGTGNNVIVYMATSKAHPDHTFAIKKVNFSGQNCAKQRERFEGEVEIFLRMDHPNIARLVDVYEYIGEDPCDQASASDELISKSSHLTPTSIKSTFTPGPGEAGRQEHIMLVMEHMKGGEVFQRIKAERRFPEPKAARTIRQMLLALNYIHRQGVFHGDVKLENFMYDSPDSDHLKLIDFGFSKNGRSGKRTASKDQSFKLCGTVSYLAPEAFLGFYTSQCDMWSVGVIVFALLAGYMPFPRLANEQQKEQIAKICEGKWLIREEVWQGISPLAKDFVFGLLHLNPKERLTAQMALNHPFITTHCSEPRSGSDNVILTPCIMTALRSFGCQSKFRQVCLSMIAWSLSYSEQAMVEDIFLAMDKTSKGRLSCAELRACMEQADMKGEDIDKIIAALDIHRDKEVHYTDFLGAVASTIPTTFDEAHMADVFRKFDIMEHGYITECDLRAVLGDEVSGEKVEHLLAEVDSKRQGVVTYHDFVAFLRATPTFIESEPPALRIDGLDSPAAEADSETLGKIISSQLTAASCGMATGNLEAAPAAGRMRLISL
eukprot:TRINITY_DN3368_c1_g1_i1.p1 TRINITY_DN3368_c1_g1~~TRINITY_DN3368_c1_g1_i1.p1  ORF type:complete len:654 (+),score=155.42 TRINITY_DN3368_c1_g1_i1:153-2114(+)